MNQKLPDIMNQLTLLAQKMNAERLDVLKDNEEHIAKGGFESDSDGDDDIGEEGDDGMGADEDFEDSDEEFKKQ